MIESGWSALKMMVTYLQADGILDKGWLTGLCQGSLLSLISTRVGHAPIFVDAHRCVSDNRINKFLTALPNPILGNIANVEWSSMGISQSR